MHNDIRALSTDGSGQQLNRPSHPAVTETKTPFTGLNNGQKNQSALLEKRGRNNNVLNGPDRFDTREERDLMSPRNDVHRMENVLIPVDTSRQNTENDYSRTAIGMPFYSTRYRVKDPNALQQTLSKNQRRDEKDVSPEVPERSVFGSVAKPIVVMAPPPQEKAEEYREGVTESQKKSSVAPVERPSSPLVEAAPSLPGDHTECRSRPEKEHLVHYDFQAEETQIREIIELRKKLAPSKKGSKYSLMTCLQVMTVVTIALAFLLCVIMHVALRITTRYMREKTFPSFMGKMHSYDAILIIGIVSNVVAALVLIALTYFFLWRLDWKYYSDALTVVQAAAEDFQTCQGLERRKITENFKSSIHCRLQWRELFEKLANSIALASHKVDSLNELVEVTEAQERQQQREPLPCFNVWSNPDNEIEKSTVPPLDQKESTKQPSREMEGSSQQRTVNNLEGMQSVLQPKGLAQNGIPDVDNLDLHNGPRGQSDAVVSGEIGPMVVYIICRIFLDDTTERLSEAEDEQVSANLRQMSNTFNDAVTRVAASTGGVVVGIELDSAIITYNAFSPIPAVSAMSTAYKAAMALERELLHKKDKLTCDGKLDVSWGMVLQHCRLLVENGGSAYLKQPYVYSTELEFGYQVVELCRLLKCTVLSLASGAQSNRTLQIIPVDVIGVESTHTMFLYELKTRKSGDTRLLEDKMIDGLLQIHNHKFNDAIETLEEIKNVSHNVKRLRYLAAYLKQLVAKGEIDVPNPYFRAGPSWEFLEMVAMKQDYGKTVEISPSDQFSRPMTPDDGPIQDTPSDATPQLSEPQDVHCTPAGSDASGRTGLESADSVFFAGRLGSLAPKDGFGTAASYAEKITPNPAFPQFQIERDDAFADIEKLETSPTTEEPVFIRDNDGPPTSYSRRGSYSQSLNMSFKIPSLQSSIIVGSSARSHMVSASKAQRAVVITGNETSVPLPSEDSPTKLLKFILGDLIAEGTGGREVYRGLHPNGRIVAIKKMPISEHSIDLKAAEQELETLARLKHPNILRYVASCYTDSEFYIIMEFISGGSLTDLIRNFGPLPREAVRRYAMDSLSGLEYLHRRGIVHRDISTNNIMVTIDGECKISDFGGAFLFSEKDPRVSANNSFGLQWSTTFLEMSCASVDSSMNMSQIGHPQQTSTVKAKPRHENIFGTPVYMSPQAAKGIVDPKNDIWSFGIVLCYCSTGCIPFKEEDLKAPSKVFLDNLCNGSVRPVIPHGELDRGLEKLITMCLQEEMDDRPSASELLKNPYILQGNSRKSIRG